MAKAKKSTKLKFAVVATCIALASAQQGYGGSHPQQGQSPQPPPGQYRPQGPPPPRGPPGQQQQYPKQGGPPQQQGPEGYGRPPPGPPGYGAPPPQGQGQGQGQGQPYGGPPPQGPGYYGGPPPPRGPPQGYHRPPPGGPPQQQPPPQQEGPGFFSKLKSKLFVADDQPQQGQRPPTPGPYGAMYGGPGGAGMGGPPPSPQRPALPPPPPPQGGPLGGAYPPGGGGPPGWGAPGAAGAGVGGGAPPPPAARPADSYAGPGMPARPPGGEAGGPNLLQKLKAKVSGAADGPQGQHQGGGWGGPPGGGGQQQQGGPPPLPRKHRSLVPPPGPYYGYGGPPYPGGPAPPPPPPPPGGQEEDVPSLTELAGGGLAYVPSPRALERKKLALAREHPNRLQLVARFEGVLARHRMVGAASPGVPRGLPALSTAELLEEMLPAEDAEQLRALGKEDGAERQQRALALLQAAHQRGQLNLRQLPQEHKSWTPLREGAEKLLQFMARTQIPVTVLSDGYTNIIAEILKAQAPQICDQYERRLPQDLVIFANSIRLDDYAGFYPSGFEGAPVSEKNLSLGEMNKVRPGLVKTQRPNLLVLGSSPEGWDLAPGFETGIILSVGFMEWTKEAASDLNKCASNYDVVIFHAKGDASFEYVLDLLGGIFPGYFSQ